MFPNHTVVQSSTGNVIAPPMLQNSENDNNQGKDAHTKKRRKNTEAAKWYRDAKKRKDKEIDEYVHRLEQRNTCLRNAAHLLQCGVDHFKEQLKNSQSTTQSSNNKWGKIFVLQ